MRKVIVPTVVVAIAGIAAMATAFFRTTGNNQ